MSMDRERITVRLTRELSETLKRRAQKRGDSLNETIVTLLRLGLEVESNRAPARTQQQRV